MKKAVKNIIKKTFVYSLLIIFFLLPSLINIKSSHPWGDDFAHYIHQAKNFVQNNKIEDVGVIFDINTLNWGSPQYVPMGFPLLLSITYSIFGNSMFHFNILMSIIYFFFGITLYLYLKTKLSNIKLSLLLTAITIYNPWLVYSKAGILTDIPFLLFLLIILLLLENFKPKKNYILYSCLIGIITGFTFTIRPIWPTLALSILLYSIFEIIKNKKITKIALGYIIIFFIATVFNFGLHRYVFNIRKSPGFYTSSYSIMKDLDIKKSINSSISLFSTIKSTIYIPSYIPLITKDIIYLSTILILVSGLFIKLFSRVEVSDLFTIVYFFLLFFLKRNSSQGFRYMLPFIPSFLGYISLFLIKINIYKRNSFYLIILVFFFISYYHPIKNIIAQTNTILDGPQLPIVEETFVYITNNIPDNSVIIFRKPLALSLYTNKKTHPVLPFHITDQASLNQLESEYSNIGTNYFLHDTTIESYEEVEYLVKFLEKTNKVKLIYHNQRFELYEFNKI